MKDEQITLDGVLVEAHPNAMFIVEIDSAGRKHRALCYACGKIRKNFIRLIVGDKVTVELSPYDLSRGRIVYRDR